MPLYRYKALNTRGEVLDGTMEAGSEAEVALRLQEQGHLPVEARPASEARAVEDWKALFKPKPFSGQRLVQFTQQLATLLNAGQPLDRALTILLDLPEEPEAKRTITELRDAVRGGVSLSTALERQHGTFSRLYVNMVRAGEAGGSLEDTLQRLADYLESARVLRGRVINALIYPAILIVMVGASLLFLLGYVVPQFAAMYESLDAELPVFTQIVLGLGEFVRDWWILLVVVPAIAAYAFRLDRARPVAGRAIADGYLHYLSVDSKSHQAPLHSFHEACAFEWRSRKPRAATSVKTMARRFACRSLAQSARMVWRIRAISKRQLHGSKIQMSPSRSCRNSKVACGRCSSITVHSMSSRGTAISRRRATTCDGSTQSAP